MKITKLHTVAKSRLAELAQLAEAAYGQRPDLPRGLSDLESDLLAGILASASTEFLREHATRLHRPDGSPVPGFYELFVKGLQDFLCLDLVALFGTTAEEAAPVLFCAASVGDAESVSTIRKIQLVCSRLSNLKLATDGFGGMHVFPVHAQMGAFRGPGASTLPQSGRVVLLSARHGVTAALLYDGDRPEWLPDAFNDNLIAQAARSILLPELYRLRMDELLAARAGVLYTVVHESAAYIATLSSLVTYLEHIDRREDEADRERKKAEIMAGFRTCLEELVDLYRRVRDGELDPEARRSRGRQSGRRRSKKPTREGPTS